MSVARIVAIDPDAEARAAYLTHIGGEGHDVRPAASAVADLDVIRTEPPDLILIDNQQVELSFLEFRFLNALCEQRSRVRTREDLLDSVWGPESGVSVRSVDSYVKRLRKKLGPARRCIETVRGVGYRMAAPRAR